MTDFTDTVIPVENDAMHGPQRYVVAHTCTTCGALTRDRPTHHRWHLTQDVTTTLNAAERLGPDDVLILTATLDNLSYLNQLRDILERHNLANRVMFITPDLQPRIAPREPQPWTGCLDLLFEHPHPPHEARNAMDDHGRPLGWLRCTGYPTSTPPCPDCGHTAAAHQGPDGCSTPVVLEPCGCPRTAW